MLRGFLRAIDREQMEQLHAGALRVLERTGLQIQGEFLLKALADAGCQVDFAARRAWFKPELVEQQIAGQRGRYTMGSCDVLQEALRYGFPVNFAPMPILGATSPITPAGSVVVAAAEILGCMTATTLIDPDVYYYSTSIAGEMDMRTTQVCYATPAAILTDVALHQLFRDKYGLVHNIEPAYVEAKVPGLQAAMMKVYRQMAFGSTVSLPLAIGVLDSAAVFSPTQAMIDLEVNEALHKFYRGMEVTEETLCLDLIEQLEYCTRQTYLESEHTLKHFRRVGWNPRLFDRTCCDHAAPVRLGDEDILQAADRTWRELVAAQTPPNNDAAFVRELDRIVAAARTELLKTSEEH